MNTLYRFFAADDTLLYVGITSSPPQRFKAHKREKEWWSDIARIELEHLESRKALERAEREAIEREKPKHNIVFASPRRTRCQEPKRLRPSRWKPHRHHYFISQDAGCFGYVIGSAGGGKMWVHVHSWTGPELPGRVVDGTSAKLIDLSVMESFKFSDTPEGIAA